MNHKLIAKVNAQNKVNGIANDIWFKLRIALLPFVGKKILKAGGELTEAAKKAIDGIFPDCKVARHWKIRSGYTLGFQLSVSEGITDSCGCVYREASVYLGELDGDILKKLYSEPLNLPTNYNAADIEKARELVYLKERELSQAKDALAGFGEHDNC